MFALPAPHPAAPHHALRFVLASCCPTSCSQHAGSCSPLRRQQAMQHPTSSRRRFIAGATSGGAAALGFPAVSRAQGSPISLRFQSTWPSNDIFHEFAQDYARKVNDMAEGQLKIEVLPAGAVVKAFDLLDAVSTGTLDGGHGVVAYWRSEEHTSELQSLMRISYAVFCLQKHN